MRVSIARSAFLGWVLVAQSEKGIKAVLLGDRKEELWSELRMRFPEDSFEEISGSDRLTQSVLRKIEKPGSRFCPLLDLTGSLFQMQVWRELQKIPVGSTLSYRELAERLGKPKACRAVAGACAQNSVAVLVPCHRVIGSHGELSGYRWGVQRKRRLLEMEKAKFILG